MKTFKSPNTQDLGESLQAIYHNASILRDAFEYNRFKAGNIIIDDYALLFLDRVKDSDLEGFEIRKKDMMPTPFIVRYLIEAGISHSDIMRAFSLANQTFYRIKKKAYQ